MDMEHIRYFFWFVGVYWIVTTRRIFPFVKPKSILLR